MIAAILNLDKGAGAFGKAVEHVECGLAHRHDVVHLHPLQGGETEIGKAIILRIELLAIAEDEIDFGHVGEHGRLGLGGAAGHDDTGSRVFAAGTADCLARLAGRLGRHRAGVENDGIPDIRTAEPGADHFRFIGIEPAAEGDDFGLAHGHTARWDGSVPSNSWATGPVIRI